MTHEAIPCLILACGNTLRGDDGVGPWLATQAGRHFPTEKRLRILAPQQWTPDLAEEVARAQAVIFVDCAADGAPGAIRSSVIEPGNDLPRMMSHHLSASDLLALSRSYYGSIPGDALLLSVGAGSLEMREGFSEAVQAALTDAENVLIGTANRLLDGTQEPTNASSITAADEASNGGDRNPEGSAADSVRTSKSA